MTDWYDIILDRDEFLNDPVAFGQLMQFQYGEGDEVDRAVDYLAEHGVVPEEDEFPSGSPRYRLHRNANDESLTARSYMDQYLPVFTEQVWNTDTVPTGITNTVPLPVLSDLRKGRLYGKYVPLLPKLKDLLEQVNLGSETTLDPVPDTPSPIQNRIAARDASTVDVYRIGGWPLPDTTPKNTVEFPAAGKILFEDEIQTLETEDDVAVRYDINREFDEFVALDGDLYWVHGR